MIALALALLVFQTAPAPAAAVDASEQSLMDEWRAAQHAAAAAASEPGVGWTADEVATAMSFCSDLVDVGLPIEVARKQAGEQQQRLALLRQTAALIEGVERDDARSLGHLEAALATEGMKAGEQAQSLSDSLDAWARLYEAHCP